MWELVFTLSGGLELYKGLKMGVGGRLLPSTPGQSHDNLLSAHVNSKAALRATSSICSVFFGQAACPVNRDLLLLFLLPCEAYSVLTFLTLLGWPAVSRKAPRKTGKRNQHKYRSIPYTIRVWCRGDFSSIHRCIFHLRRKRFHFGTFDLKVVSFRLRFYEPRNQHYGWYCKPFLLRSDQNRRV